jgi:spore maturation protein CgeB
MKIIIHRYNSICEPDYINAFKQLGIEVIEDKLEITDKSIPLDKRVEYLGEKILTEEPVFVFSINYFPFIALICEKLKCLYVCVSVDCPVVELFSNTIKSPYNRVFLFDREQYNDIYAANPDCIFYLPLGVNSDRINQEIGTPIWKGVSKNIDYKYDVSFIGSLYSEKDAYADIEHKLSDRERGYVDGLISAQSLFPGQSLLEECITEETIAALKAADKNFYPSDVNVMNTDRFVAVNNYLSYHLTFLDRVRFLNMIGGMSDLHFFTRSDTKLLKNVNCHGGVSSLKEMPMVFRQSKININTTMRAIRTGMPQRIWDVLGSGGFLLSNYQADMDGELIPGKHLAAYENEAEACELISYFLSHEDEREEIAETGYRYVLERAQVVNRVTEMIRIVLATLEK